MIKYHINNDLAKLVQSQPKQNFDHLTKEEHIILYNEIKNATLQGIDGKIVDLYNKGECDLPNEVNSLLLYFLNLSPHKPTGPQKIKSPGSYCDIDLDFSQSKRELIFKYLAEKYGQDRCGQIATFGTMGAKGAIRNSARSLGYSTELQNKIAKNIPELPGITIQDSIDASKEFAELILKNKEVKHIVDIARKLEGLPNSLSVHASAGIISDVTTTNHIPMMISAKKDNAVILSQFDMKDVEAGGLLKFDILGLKTLDIINETVKLIKKNKGIDIDIKNIDVNDPGIYSLLNNGHVTVIFQFDGTAAAYLPKCKPQNINEISDLTSILRPGPMSMGMVDQYVNAKFKGEKFKYNLKDQALIDKVWEICYTSYGLLIYQEQCIKCFTEIGGYNEIEGDNARRAMGKKLPEEMAKLKVSFIEGGKKKGYQEKDLDTLFDQIEGFSGYGFNKSHAICYSVITCQTAWLSNYYPLEFFTAAMSIDSDKTDDIRRYIKAIKERGYEVISPDVNRSDNGFSILGDTGILFGLGAIKGVGQAVSKKIITRKPKSGYKSLGHFIRRNLDIVNSKILESYTKGGCFKGFGYNKESILQSIPYILNFISILKDYTKYKTIFDNGISLDSYIDSCIIKTSMKEDNLSYEIDALGLYISRHPMDDYDIKGMNDLSYVEFFDNNENFISIGCLSGIEIRKTKAKLNMCKFNLANSKFNLPCIIFPKAYTKFINNPIIAEGRMVVVTGKLKKEESETVLIVEEVSDDVDKYLVKKSKDVVEFILSSKIKMLLEKTE